MAEELMTVSWEVDQMEVESDMEDSQHKNTRIEFTNGSKIELMPVVNGVRGVTSKLYEASK